MLNRSIQGFFYVREKNKPLSSVDPFYLTVVLE